MLIKKAAVSLIMLAAASTLSACAGRYIISTNDGHMINAKGKPVIDKETGMISYEDASGNMHQLQKHDVKEIVEE
ncbi:MULTISPECIES: YgdI/YgdR family lipoprotein [unclassified Pantoea]|uniref:YgdI/YgdR family lipoprotein n=1 Tax=unclassified Pantoea TaxID=2630326 RepID=UPI0009DD945B|nr:MULTISPECIES: YgdI/YgdR family lipoprotein [unclassified Pantoea]MDU6389186.1 YgdI/YgdR family lipoprotein [Pantoea sp.]